MTITGHLASCFKVHDGCGSVVMVNQKAGLDIAVYLFVCQSDRWSVCIYTVLCIYMQVVFKAIHTGNLPVSLCGCQSEDVRPYVRLSVC